MIILSDGNLQYKRPVFARLVTVPSSQNQHNLFQYFCMKLYNKKAKNYLINTSCGPCKYSTLFLKKAVEDLLELSPNYNTTPGPNLSYDSYLSSKQPTLKYILNKKRNIRELAFRIWFDFDGCILPSFKVKCKRETKKGRKYVYYQLQFECEIRISETNPNLRGDLLELGNSLGFKTFIP